MKLLWEPRTIPMAIRSYYKAFIVRQYEKLIDNKSIDDAMYRVYKCPDCYVNGSCYDCGCPFLEVALSEKSCKNVKF